MHAHSALHASVQEEPLATEILMVPLPLAAFLRVAQPALGSGVVTLKEKLASVVFAPPQAQWVEAVILLPLGNIHWT